MSASTLRRMEDEIRGLSPGLPIDALLPELAVSAGTGPSPEAEAPEAAVPEPPPEVLTLPEPEPAGAAPSEASGQDLDAEIRAFLNRDQRGLADDDDFSEFLGRGIDPNVE